MTGLLGVYEEQVNLTALSLPIYAVVASVLIFLALLGVCFIDIGFVRRKFVLDTLVQKFVAVAGGAIGWVAIGMPLWMWQFNQAFGVPNAFRQAFKDWWFGGHFTNTAAANIDPAVLPQAETMQVFFIFWMCYCMTFAALMQGAWLERMKALPLFIFSIAIGVVMPLMGYLTWGPTSFLTNNGFHEFVGVTVGYIPVGVFALVVGKYLGPRLGAFEPHESGAAPIPNNEGYVGLGVILLMAVVPFVAIASVYFVPGEGVLGITMTTTGIGVIAINSVCAFAGGALSGVVLSYVRKEAIWALVGPICGFICCGPSLDIAKAWHCYIWGLIGPVMVVLGYKACMRLKLDDSKVVPLTILPALFGSFFHGFVYWGTPTGGYFGLTGKYGFQNAEITPWMQLLGDVVVVGIAAGVALVLGFIVKATIGLRKDHRSGGLMGDPGIWGQHNFGEEPDSVIQWGERLPAGGAVAPGAVPATAPGESS